MPAWLSVVLSLAGSALINTVVCLLITRVFNKSFKKHDATLEKQKEEANELFMLRNKKVAEERKDEIIECITDSIKPLQEKVDNISSKLDKVEDGALATLRNDILTCYYRCTDKGYRNDYDYQNIHHMYEAYSELHGNSYVADIMERFDELPTKEETVILKTVERKIKEKILN